jgi:hypothetical protein
VSGANGRPSLIEAAREVMGRFERIERALHILRADAAASETVARAVDVFDRNVRALTRVIETYTAEVDGARSGAGRPRETVPPPQR